MFRFKGAMLTAVVSHLPSVTNKDSCVYIDSQSTGDAIRSITETSTHATLRRRSAGNGKAVGHEVDWDGGGGRKPLPYHE